MNYDKYGKIKCAALKLGDKVYIGKTHAHCFAQDKKGVLRNAEQGFLTENGFFVDRKLAVKIAEYFKQIRVKHPPEDELYSEDYLEL